MYGWTRLTGDEWLRFIHAGEVKRWTDKANRSNERLRSYCAGEVKRWTLEIISWGKEMCGNEGVVF